MSESRRPSLADQVRIAEQESAASNAARARAYVALGSLSLDFAGSKPSDFFNSDDAMLCQEFLALAASRNVPATSLSLQALRSREKLTKAELMHGPNQPAYIPPKFVGTGPSVGGYGSRPTSRREKSRATERYYRDNPPKPWDTLWRGSGYYIGAAGHISLQNGVEDAVFLCTDGRLRCARSGPLFQGESRAYGHGTLPPTAKIKVGYTTTENDDNYVVHKFHDLSLNDRFVHIIRGIR